MSHEIRTPLNGVLGMAELLRDSPKLDERQRRYALVIHHSGKALLQLINDILDFSKIEAGKLELDKARFCVREMVEDALEIMAERAQSKGLELICDVPFDMDTFVFGDCLRLRQVIINLLSNAVKFTERGDITTTVSVLPGIETSTFTFEVTDTGIGVRPENHASIFESFVQEDSSTSRRYGGTGLGLAICKQLLELMGGTIGVRSTVGKGSTFHFSVPLEVDRTAQREKPSTALPTTRILIIEKSKAARSTLRQHLRSWGVISTELDSAQEAITRLTSAFCGEFDIFMIDAQLPRTTAVAMVAALRRIPEFADTPILMMHTGSGDAPPESREMRGPVAWLNKPIRRSLLQKSLERLLGKEQARPAESPSQRAGAAQSAEALRKLKVRRTLVVEDNPVNREVAGAMLETVAEAHMASSGKEALEMLANARYDVVLMDCQMPEMDGYETTRRFREWELVQGCPRTPVVALTANALKGDAERCFAAGMDHYLTKPFSIEQLHAVLESCAAPGAPVPAGASAGRRRAEVLDSKTLGRLRNLNAAGGQDLLARLAALYASSSAALIESLRVAVGSEDLEALGKAAHGLKSSSANVGATGLAAICGELEAAARNGKAQAAKGLVERLIREHEEVLDALEKTHVAA